MTVDIVSPSNGSSPLTDTHPVSPAYKNLLVSGYRTETETLSSTECQNLLSEIWEYIEDVSYYKILQSDETTWDKLGNVDLTSYGSHWIGVEASKWIAERIYEKIYERNDLNVSRSDLLFSWNGDKGSIVIKMDDESTDTSCQFTALVALKCGQYVLTRRETGDEKVLHATAGDVILYRSGQYKYSSASSTDYIAGLCLSMSPDVTSSSSAPIPQYRFDCYRNSQKLSPHLPFIRPGSCPPHPQLRNYFRYGASPLSLRTLQLYNLVPHGDVTDDAIRAAILRGVVFSEESYYDCIPSNGESAKDVMHECDDSLLLQHKKLSTKIPPAVAESVYLPQNTPILGQDKFLGGIPSPCGEYIYAVPGHARRVLALHVPSDTLTYLGPEYPGQFKWLRGVVVPPTDTHPKGLCIALPSNAHSILKIDPVTQHVNTFGRVEGTWMYHGGDVNPNTNLIYAIPANARRVLKIDPFKETVEDIGPDFGTQPQKWYGGILSKYNNCMYGVPHNATGVLKINPDTEEISVIGEGLDKGLWKWHGGLVTLDGTKIISFPNNHNSILIIDVTKDRVYTIGEGGVLKSGRHRNPHDGKYKYLGGALTLDGRYAYLFPADAERVLRIDTLTDEVKCIGPIFFEGWGKYQNGFCSPRDGCVYGIPQRSKSVVRIIPPKDEGDDEVVDVVYCGDEMLPFKDKFEGGVMVDGIVHCMPLRAKGWLKVIPPNINQI